jgi:hypothetical protein
MAFIVGPGVRSSAVEKASAPWRTYIGLSPRRNKYLMGRWCFNNAISATVFEYNVSRVGEENATAVIMRMEKMLDANGALSDAVSMDVWDAVGTIPAPQAKIASFIGKLMTKASSGIGSFVADQQVDAMGGYNPHKPEDSYGISNYVDFALSYFKKYPNNGPAYKYYSEDPSIKKH